MEPKPKQASKARRFALGDRTNEATPGLDTPLTDAELLAMDITAEIESTAEVMEVVDTMTEEEVSAAINAVELHSREGSPQTTNNQVAYSPCRLLI